MELATTLVRKGRAVEENRETRTEKTPAALMSARQLIEELAGLSRGAEEDQELILQNLRSAVEEKEREISMLRKENEELKSQRHVTEVEPEWRLEDYLAGEPEGERMKLVIKPRNGDRYTTDLAIRDGNAEFGIVGLSVIYSGPTHGIRLFYDSKQLQTMVKVRGLQPLPLCPRENEIREICAWSKANGIWQKSVSIVVAFCTGSYNDSHL